MPQSGPMSSLIRVLGLALCLSSAVATAAPKLIGVITATTAKNQTDTAVPFTIPQYAPLLIHCDATAYVKFVSTAAGVATTSSYNYRIGAGETVMDRTNSAFAFISVLSASGTANCYISEVQD